MQKHPLVDVSGYWAVIFDFKNSSVSLQEFVAVDLQETHTSYRMRTVSQY